MTQCKINRRNKMENNQRPQDGQRSGQQKAPEQNPAKKDRESKDGGSSQRR
jgi:hypothetical protein